MIDWSLIDNYNDSSTHNCSGDKESFIKELQDNMYEHVKDKYDIRNVTKDRAEWYKVIVKK